ncbi:hypothetical protein GCM10010922_01310 [Microbacterium sorbitolivorans]|uniref:Uncharacterized protein n=1 Tax=Microbacterium sorbitolivorans TaxID=1867410 RepID=A0A367Y9H6_9MICO|nr:hypothetical protein [Microbacterium sorbitolivorans]RCK61682.1 hypothetical protein DTO57_03380 [Microbacterium sorbitolivorans]GGF30107.1 hypothetical protein GCM10010922_01310 [Microbacterium sorbitolivorans]
MNTRDIYQNMSEEELLRAYQAAEARAKKNLLDGYRYLAADQVRAARRISREIVRRRQGKTSLLDQARRAVQRYPVAAIAITFVIGIALGVAL